MSNKRHKPDEIPTKLRQVHALTDLFILRGGPEHVRSDNGLEFIARRVQDWIAEVGARTAYIAPGSAWENGYIESFNARLHDELLDGEIFYTLKEARIIVEAGVGITTLCAPHGSLGLQAAGA